MVQRQIKRLRARSASGLLKIQGNSQANSDDARKSHTDKKIKYIRYADDFLIAVNGRREDCVEIKRKLAEFIGGMLKMELSEERRSLPTAANMPDSWDMMSGYGGMGNKACRKVETIKAHAEQ